MFNQRHIAIALAEKKKQQGLGVQAPAISPGLPQMPSPIPPIASPSTSALHGLAGHSMAPSPSIGGMPTPPQAPTNKLPNLNKLPGNPYKMTTINKIDKFPRLFKVTKV